LEGVEKAKTGLKDKFKQAILASGVKENLQKFQSHIDCKNNIKAALESVKRSDFGLSDDPDENMLFGLNEFGCILHRLENEKELPCIVICKEKKGELNDHLQVIKDVIGDNSRTFNYLLNGKTVPLEVYEFNGVYFRFYEIVDSLA
jgi:hypothetical protein